MSSHSLLERVAVGLGELAELLDEEARAGGVVEADLRAGEVDAQPACGSREPFDTPSLLDRFRL